MKLFECCHHCTAPKRHPGCHDRCPEYKEQKEILEQLKENALKKRTQYKASTDYYNNPVWRKHHIKY